MVSSEFSPPRSKRCFEDYVAGAVYEFAETIGVTEEEIIAFARQYDPQAIHLDAAAAAKSPYKGLIASGTQTIGLTMLLLVHNFFPERGTLGSPGFDELRWLKPLRPGDIGHLRVNILETRPSRSNPDRGLVTSLVETINQHGETILSFKTPSFIGRRS